MKTIVHYLKTRALRQIAQWLIVAAISILTLGAFAVADAYAAYTLPPPPSSFIPSIPSIPNIPKVPLLSSYTCADLAGNTAGTCGIDEGCMNFDYEPPTASYAGEICGPTVAYVNDVLQPFELHGWVWDTNLGYVSLRCDSSGKNNGIECGSVEYGIKVDPTTGEMSGWAYSNNMGWISFACESGFNEGFACGAIDYNTSIEMTIGEDLGVISGYAWADTVGWFDFETGDVHALLLDILMRTSSDETAWGVWTKAEIEENDLEMKQEDKTEDSGELGIDRKYMPLADKTAGYDIFVHFSDIAGTPIEDTAGDVVIEINTEWDDTVKFDQTSSTPSNGNLLNNGPTYKAGLDVDARPYTLTLNTTDLTTGGVSNSYHGVTVSSAPTDGGNCLDGDNDGSCYGGAETGDFLYKNFGESVEANTLTYLGVNLSITIPSTGETWTRYITPLSPYSSGRQLEFRPMIDIPTLDYLFIPGDTADSSRLPLIQAIRNKVDEFYIQGATDNGITQGYTINFELSEDDADTEYVFIETLEDDFETALSTFSITDVASIGSQLLAIPYSPVEEEGFSSTVPGAQLHTVVTVIPTPPLIPSFIPPTIKYYNNGLPRVFDSEIETQTAEIVSGSVFSPGAKNVVQGSDVPLFGDTAVYELRTAILEDVSGLIRGVNLEGLSDITITAGTGIDSLYENKFKDNRFYYFEDQDVTIEDLSSLATATGGKPLTIVIKGGDLYLKGSIDIADQEFGFIVFESDEDTNEATKGGRIYIHSDVTDLVNVHIFSDGPIFRYTDNVCYFTGSYGPGLEGLREPNFVESGRCSSAGTFEEPKSGLSNQFYLKGNIASFNCLGCSTDLQPSRGDGLDLGGANALNFAIARLYDFNYFSYFNIHPVTGADSGTRSTNVTANAAITNKDKAVYFEYSPAPTDLLGFRNF